MKEIDEIEKLTDKVVFNELVERAREIISKQRLSERNSLRKQLKQNLIYREYPNVYKEIEDALRNDPERTQQINDQVERNKVTLENALSPEIEVDNIITFRALKSMYDDKVRQREGVCAQLIKLKHLSYIVKTDEYLAKCFSGKATEDEKNRRDEIRGNDPIVYDSIKAIHKEGERNRLRGLLHEKSRKYLNLLKEGLNAFGDKDNRDKISAILEDEENKQTKEIINEYDGIRMALESKYEPQHVNHTRLDGYVIRVGDELRGRYYGPDAITYAGRSKSLIVRQNIFQRAIDRIKRAFTKENYEDVEDDRSEIDGDKNRRDSNKRGSISPKIKVRKVEQKEQQTHTVERPDEREE